MSVAPMSRQTKRAYLRLCPKNDLVHKGLSQKLSKETERVYTH